MGALPRVCLSMPAEAALCGVPDPGVLYVLEVRLDAHPAEPAELARLFSLCPHTIATCRPGPRSHDDCAAVLLRALAAGAGWVDLDRSTPPALLAQVRAEVRRLGRGLIVSHHDFGGTPPREALVALLAGCYALGADLAKIACLAAVPADCERVLSLYDGERRPLLAFCMGEAGRASRVQAVVRGAPFMYCAAGPGQETAPGQLEAADLLRQLAVVCGGGA